MRRLLTILLLTGLIASAAAQQPDKTRLLLILDCSNSMWDHWQSNSKIKVTQQVLLSFLDSVSRQHDVDVALRVFGHLNKDQFGTRLEVPFGNDNIYRLQSKIKTLVPNGGCTAAAALTDALSDFPATGSSCNLILIISDGMNGLEADGDEGANGLSDEICDVARQVQLSGVVVQTFVLGIGNGAFNHADCAGSVFPVAREEEFAKTLYDIFRLSGKKAKVVLKLLDESGELYETEHPVAFYDQRTGVIRQSTIYSIDQHLQPDTLLMDPLVTYDMYVYTHPWLRKTGLQFDVDRVNTVLVINKEGTLKIKTDGRQGQWLQQMPDAVVWQDNDLVTTVPIGEPLKLGQGYYDIEIRTMPTTLLRSVMIRPGAITELTIPTPGMLILSKPKGITTGAIFRINDGRLEHATDLNPSTAGERLLLQPGQYELVLHPQNATKYNKVQTKRFVIESSQTTKIQF